ncbi:unnamed protein product [Brassica napus]|uniref:(rape) hypothetical protein n=1 Tax=Brassica napus TaxID=3708 RepID=A0A816ZWS4_BRANA|nr:unnamed protein product [Brassica napus]
MLLLITDEFKIIAAIISFMSQMLHRGWLQRSRLFCLVIDGQL